MKLSELKDTDIILVINIISYNEYLTTVAEFKGEYPHQYIEDKQLEIYSTKTVYANFKAKAMLKGTIKHWNKEVWNNIIEQDINDIQAILDKIVARNPSDYVAYQMDELLEIDIQ